MSTVQTLKAAPQTGADLLVKSLEAQGVEYTFGIPGAKIDKVFDTLLDSSIKTIVCRHEQNAAFIAAGIGRMTGKAGVALVTSGPGCSNLVTGLATANSEGDAVVAIGGAVPLADRLKQIHQSMDTVSIFRPITKFSAEIDSPDSVSEVIASAFRAAESARPRAAFISVPKDIMMGAAEGSILTPVKPELLGPGDQEAIASAADLIAHAERPVLLLGLLASETNAAEAVRGLLQKAKIPVVCTYQGAGVVPMTTSIISEAVSGSFTPSRQTSFSTQPILLSRSGMTQLSMNLVCGIRTVLAISSTSTRRVLNWIELTLRR
jgi:acetolactate synthase I/II/III large subunit